MSKPVKKLITESYKKRFGDIDGAVMVDLRGVSANDNNTLRHELQQEAIRITVLRNSLAKLSFQGTAMEPMNGLIEGACALAYGGASVVDIARRLLERAKSIENMGFRGALMEGQIFGPDEIEALSKFPTLEEAQAIALQMVLSPGGNLVGSILGPGRRIASLVKAIEEKLQQGEPSQAAA